ncbi:hypothetical protein SAMN04488104_11061 [Algoriphagus faecimaris]|uniref:Uncharacterized protein n=1 Tax=Algoriphagus faecimaris TaxID=686796 RepID=A0A1G6YGR2_9BACT|nr:hypothetical protein SAMN04488104_11061 [Algoriphagus faecimaris]
MMLCLASFQVDASILRYYCTETWSNINRTYYKSYHCYGPETTGDCEADCMIGEGCSRNCCVDEDEAAPGF